MRQDGRRIGTTAWALASICLFSAAAALAAPKPGYWDGTVRGNGIAIEFPLEIRGTDERVEASFFNGDEKVTSTAGAWRGDSLHLEFGHYAARLDATLADGVLRGTYGGARVGSYEIELRPRQGRKTSKYEAGAPAIAGEWILPFASPKGEQAFRLLVREQGSAVSAAILRVDGDTGLLTGGWRDGRFLLQKFDGARSYLLDIVPESSDQLKLTLSSLRGQPQTFTAVRPAAASALGVAPSDFAAHTRWTDPTAPFAFSFPDLDGNIVSNTDARFADKVLIINITGSWCPNCHDEAPFLAEIDRKYRDRGVRVIALTFEEAEQLANPTRVRAFIERYGVRYDYLLAGEPGQLKEKIPLAANLNAWPTTFFIGRDGRVRGSHTGFAAPASGEFHQQLRREFEAKIEALLAEPGLVAYLKRAP